MGNAIEYLDILRAASIPDAQAEAISRIIVSDREANAATKADIISLRAELKDDHASLRAELKGDYDSLKTELKGGQASLKAEIEGIKTDIKWIKAIGFVIFSMIAGLYFK